MMFFGSFKETLKFARRKLVKLNPETGRVFYNKYFLIEFEILF